MHNPITQLEQVTLTTASKRFLKETAKWCFFMSVLGFILIGFLLLLAVFASTIMSFAGKMQPGIPSNMGIFMTAGYAVMSVIYFFPVYYLFQFSKKMKKALATKNEETLANAFEMLKSHYKFLGVFTIITLSLYVFAIIVASLGVL